MKVREKALSFHSSPTIRKQDGFTLLELLLVVGVGAILLLAGIGTYQLITEGQKVNDAQRLLQTVKQKIQQQFQGQVTYGAVSANLTPLIVAMDIIPNQFLQGTQPIHPWNNNVDVAVSAASALRFTITFSGLPNAACISLGSIDIDSDPDFFQLSVDGNDFTSGNLPTPQALDAICTGGSTDIVWTFY